MTPFQKKILHIDLETTGRNPYVHGIHQMAFKIEINGNIVDEFSFRVRPLSNVQISDEALEKSHSTREQVYKYTMPDVVMGQLFIWLDKYVDKDNPQDKYFLCGYGVGFDRDFLREWFRNMFREKYFKMYFHSGVIDVMSLATHYFMLNEQYISSYQLSQVAPKFGIPVSLSNLHTAEYDVSLSQQIYKRLTIIWQNVLTKR